MKLREARQSRMKKLGTRGCILGRKIRSKEQVKIKGVDCPDNC